MTINVFAIKNETDHSVFEIFTGSDCKIDPVEPLRVIYFELKVCNQVKIQNFLV